MQLKTASLIALILISIGAVLTATETLWMYWLAFRNVFGVRTLVTLDAMLKVAFLHLPLIFFFVVFYRRHRGIGALQ